MSTRNILLSSLISGIAFFGIQGMDDSNLPSQWRGVTPIMSSAHNMRLDERDFDAVLEAFKATLVSAERTQFLAARETFLQRQSIFLGSPVNGLSSDARDANNNGPLLVRYKKIREAFEAEDLRRQGKTVETSGRKDPAKGKGAPERGSRQGKNPKGGSFSLSRNTYLFLGGSAVALGALTWMLFFRNPAKNTGSVTK